MEGNLIPLAFLDKRFSTKLSDDRGQGPFPVQRNCSLWEELISVSPG